MALSLNTFARSLSTDTSLSIEVRNFFKENGEDFSTFKASCPTEEECTSDKSFHFTKRAYIHRGNADEVFAKFTALSPDKVWNGKIYFEVGHDANTDLTYTRKDELLIAPINVGQIYVSNLTITEKMKLPVALMVTDINHTERTFTVSYLANNKSHGFQKIYFDQVRDEVRIRHETYYKSDSNFRDNFLYRPIHNMLLDIFYEDMLPKILPRASAPASHGHTVMPGLSIEE